MRILKKQQFAAKDIALLVCNIAKEDSERLLSEASLDKNESIQSQTFESHFKSISFQLMLSVAWPNNHLITVGFSSNEHNKEVKFRFRLWLLGPKREKHHKREYPEVFDNHSVPYITFDEFESHYRQYGSTIVYCEVDIPDVGEEFDTSGWRSDIIVRLSRTEILLHKDALAAGCPVFREMLENKESQEVKEGRIIIEPYTSCHMFARVLNYIYTGTIPSMSDYAFELIDLAEKYQLTQLKSVCGYSIDIWLDINTVAEKLRNAYFSGFKRKRELIKKCAEFCAKHYEQVTKTDEWKREILTLTDHEHIVPTIMKLANEKSKVN